MKVHALIEHVTNSVDYWETVLGLYSNEDDAILEQAKLEQEQDPLDRDCTSWSIQEMEVK
jgi:hypothetical protein